MGGLTDDFGAFYELHVEAVTAYVARRVGRPDVTFDVVAETFARALEHRDDYDPERGAAVAWLFGIARNVVIDAARRGRVADAARRRLGMSAVTLDDDPFDVLRDELMAAEGRMLRGRGRSPWLRRRPLLLAAALVVASGSAAAAVVSLTSEDSAPLAGSVPAPSPNAAQRTYRIDLMPDLRAGQIGWCSTLALRSRRGPIGAATGCGPAAPADAAQLAGGGITVGRDRIILFTIVDKRVATVRLHDGRTIAPLPDRRLPYGWRAAVAFVTREHGNVDPTDLDWTLQDAAGRPISTAPNERAGTKHAGTATLPTRTVDPRNPPHARCPIRARALRHLRAVSAKVVKRMPATTPDVNGRAFLTCATTIYYLGDHRYRAAVLLDARDRHRPAADLPGSSPRAGNPDLVDAAGHITARRAGAGWLVVQGPSARERAVVLRALSTHP